EESVPGRLLVRVLVQRPDLWFRDHPWAGHLQVETQRVSVRKRNRSRGVGANERTECADAAEICLAREPGCGEGVYRSAESCEGNRFRSRTCGCGRDGPCRQNPI